MPAIALDESAIPQVRSRSEVLVRRGLIGLSVIAGLGVLCHLVLMLWAQNEFTQPESIVAAQSTMLARDGTLYYDLKHYPYTVCAYMPLFYSLQAALIKTGVAALTAGRILSFGALGGIFLIAWRLVLLYTNDRYCAWTATLLCASTSILLNWGTDGQVDTLALFFAVAAFYFYSRYAIRGERTLALACGFALAALFTKQTMLACPAAIFLSLLFERPKAALRFAAGVGGVGLSAILLLNLAMHGRFLTNVVFANLFPLAAEKLSPHVRYMLIASGQLIVIALAGARRVLRGRGKTALIYLALSFSVLAATAPKIGSDSNYQIEPTFVLILCSCLALHALDFFPLIFRSSKVWITLLQAPVLLHLVLNSRISVPSMLARYAKEKQFRAQVAALRPYFSGGGRVLSAETNALLRLRGRIEVEPLVYKILVRAGRIDPELVRRDIARESFSTIVLYQDLTRPAPVDIEIPSLPEAQMDEIRRHYRLVKHIPGPYQAGAYVYEPARNGL
ncbi:MAG TPA: hypothetical protein VEV17_26155 [Bryobacteraceae bacterium]|nr:hypothetical protein [Bryobacteraceae bacterium]